jgi:hypothetical protein
MERTAHEWVLVSPIQVYFVAGLFVPVDVALGTEAWAEDVS